MPDSRIALPTNSSLTEDDSASRTLMLNLLCTHNILLPLWQRKELKKVLHQRYDAHPHRVNVTISNLTGSQELWKDSEDHDDGP